MVRHEDRTRGLEFLTSSNLMLEAFVVAEVLKNSWLPELRNTDLIKADSDEDLVDVQMRRSFSIGIALDDLITKSRLARKGLDGFLVDIRRHNYSNPTTLVPFRTFHRDEPSFNFAISAGGMNRLQTLPLDHVSGHHAILAILDCISHEYVSALSLPFQVVAEAQEGFANHDKVSKQTNRLVRGDFFSIDSFLQSLPCKEDCHRLLSIAHIEQDKLSELWQIQITAIEGIEVFPASPKESKQPRFDQRAFQRFLGWLPVNGKKKAEHSQNWKLLKSLITDQEIISKVNPGKAGRTSQTNKLTDNDLIYLIKLAIREKIGDEVELKNKLADIEGKHKSDLPSDLENQE